MWHITHITVWHKNCEWNRTNASRQLIIISFAIGGRE
jgi:hypothetical protein